MLVFFQPYETFFFGPWRFIDSDVHDANVEMTVETIDKPPGTKIKSPKFAIELYRNQKLVEVNNGSKILMLGGNRGDFGSYEVWEYDIKLLLFQKKRLIQAKNLPFSFLPMKVPFCLIFSLIHPFLSTFFEI